MIQGTNKFFKILSIAALLCIELSAVEVTADQAAESFEHTKKASLQPVFEKGRYRVFGKIVLRDPGRWILVFSSGPSLQFEILLQNPGKESFQDFLIHRGTSDVAVLEFPERVSSQSGPAARLLRFEPQESPRLSQKKPPFERLSGAEEQ